MGLGFLDQPEQLLFFGVTLDEYGDDIASDDFVRLPDHALLGRPERPAILGHSIRRRYLVTASNAGQRRRACRVRGDRSGEL